MIYSGNIESTDGEKYIGNKRRRIVSKIYAQSFAMYLAAFAIGFILSRFRPFKSSVNNNQLLIAFAIPSAIIYLILYTRQLPKIENKIRNNKRYDTCNTTALAIAMPILSGLMIALLFLEFKNNQIFAAMFGALSIGAVSSIFGYTTDKDLTEPINLLSCCGIALVPVLLINIFILENNFIAIGISAFFIVLQAAILAYNNTQIKKSIKGLDEPLEEQFTNFYSMNICSSLVSITIELLNMKENADQISSR